MIPLFYFLKVTNAFGNFQQSRTVNFSTELNEYLPGQMHYLSSDFFFFFQNIYDNTCALREKRLDIEESSAEVKKDKDSLNKEYESFTKKAKVIDASVRQAENELEAFQVRCKARGNER